MYSLLQITSKHVYVLKVMIAAQPGKARISKKPFPYLFH